MTAWYCQVSVVHDHGTDVSAVEIHGWFTGPFIDRDGAAGYGPQAGRMFDRLGYEWFCEDPASRTLLESAPIPEAEVPESTVISQPAGTRAEIERAWRLWNDPEPNAAISDA